MQIYSNLISADKLNEICITASLVRLKRNVIAIWKAKAGNWRQWSIV